MLFENIFFSVFKNSFQSHRISIFNNKKLFSNSQIYFPFFLEKNRKPFLTIVNKHFQNQRKSHKNVHMTTYYMDTSILKVHKYWQNLINTEQKSFTNLLYMHFKTSCCNSFC